MSPHFHLKHLAGESFEFANASYSLYSTFGKILHPNEELIGAKLGKLTRFLTVSWTFPEARKVFEFGFNKNCAFFLEIFSKEKSCTVYTPHTCWAAVSQLEECLA